jgi:hypothetical protein
MSDITSVRQTQIVDRDEEIERLRAALTVAKAELEWWINEHRCCEGHEDEAMKVINDAIDSPNEQRCDKDACGMVLVPREPTKEMLEAAWADALAEDAAGVWRAMIAAYGQSTVTRDEVT